MVAEHLRRIIGQEHVDLAVANGENSAGGFGITPLIAEELFSYGVDVLTSGNHIWDKREIYEYLPKNPRLLRPANYSDDLPGVGDDGGEGSQRRQMRRAESPGPHPHAGHRRSLSQGPTSSLPNWIRT